MSIDVFSQIGEDQALSWSVAGMSTLGFAPTLTASHVDHLQTGFSSTLE